MDKMYVLLLCLLLIGVKCDLAQKLKKDFFNVYKNVAVTTREIAHEPITADKVTYYLFRRENPNEFIGLDINKLERLANKNVKIVFLIHGWTNDRQVQWFQDVKNAFLTRDEEWYVVQIDWKEPASAIYTVASINTYDVGNHIADLIENLIKKYEIPLENILVVGHSLGGQISGFIGKRLQKATGKKLPRIIALDPAGPLFSTRPDDKRLNKNDAEIVQVIHTDGNVFGFKDSCGTIDFYPNGGNIQPGCKQIDLFDISSVSEPAFCDHSRAWAYFAEAILNPKEFLAKKCDSWSKFKQDTCDNVTVPLGDITTKETGNFYLETNKNPPYSKKNGSGGFNILKLLQN